MKITILFIGAQSINILLQKEWLNQFCNKSNSAGASFDLNEKSTWYQMVIWQRFLPCGSESLPNSHLVPRAFFKVKSHGARENIQVWKNLRWRVGFFKPEYSLSLRVISPKLAEPFSPQKDIYIRIRFWIRIRVSHFFKRFSDFYGHKIYVVYVYEDPRNQVSEFKSKNSGLAKVLKFYFISYIIQKCENQKNAIFF